MLVLSTGARGMCFCEGNEGRGLVRIHLSYLKGYEGNDCCGVDGDLSKPSHLVSKNGGCDGSRMLFSKLHLVLLHRNRSFEIVDVDLCFRLRSIVDFFVGREISQDHPPFL